MGNGKLQQFNYSRSLITNRGTVERGIRRIANNYYAPLCGGTQIFCVCQTVLLFGSCTGTTTLSTNHYDHCHD